MLFEPINETELSVGQAIGCDLYDREYELLLERGSIIQSERHLNELVARGLFRKIDMRESIQTVSENKAESPQVTRDETRSLESIKLKIGDTLNLQSQSGNATVRYAVKLIGYLRGKGVIVSTPTQDGKVLLMRDGQSFVVRFFADKSVYAFPASIVKATNVPYPHLHLSWPNEVKGLVVRNTARAQVKLIAALTDATGRSGSAILDDLSVEGCSLFAKEALGEKNERIRVKFRLVIGEAEQYLDLDGVIRRVERSITDNSHPFQHGIQFIDIPPVYQLPLTAFVYQTLFEASA